jgi:ParB-like chromosome segregation protein Spo0J
MAKSLLVSLLERYGLKIHLVANCFPMLPKKELDQLVEDIERHGLREKIVRYKGMLLDGRNRLLACELAGVKPEFREWERRDENDTARAFILSLNLLRRHLSESQRAMVAAKLAKLGRGRRQTKFNGSIDPLEMSQAEAASSMDVSVGSVKRASTVIAKAPELVEPVEQRKIKVNAAARVAKSSKSVRSKVGERLKAGKKVTERDVVELEAPEGSPEKKPYIDRTIAKQTELITDAISKIEEIADFEQERLSDQQRAVTVALLNPFLVDIQRLITKFESGGAQV